MKKRASIFVYYDKDGIVDDYVIYMLKEMKNFIEHQVIVINGTINAEYTSALESVCDEIIYRENKGMDVSGYLYGLNHMSNTIYDYDELILYNQTIYGPVLPLDEMFSKMDNQTLDFWGLTRHPGIKNDAPDWVKDLDYMPSHIQSYFIALEKSVYSDAISFMNNMGEINGYFDAVNNFEIRFTSRMEEKGYSSSTFIDDRNYFHEGDYVMIDDAIRALSEYKSPFIKRKAFLTDFVSLQMMNKSYSRFDLLDYINDNTDYPIENIYKNIARTTDLDTYYKTFSPYIIRGKDDISEKLFEEEKVLYIIILRNTIGDRYLIEKLRNLDDRISMIISSNYLQEVNIEKFNSIKIRLIPETEIKTILKENSEYISEFNYLGIFDTGYDDVYERFFPLAYFKRDRDIIFDFNRNISIIKDHPYIGSITPEELNIGEYFTYSKKFINQSFKNDSVLQSIPERQKIHPLLCYLSNCFIDTSKVGDILTDDDLKDTDTDLYIPMAVMMSGYLPAVIIDNNTLLGQYHFDKIMLSSYKDLTVNQNYSRYDTTYNYLINALRHYETNHLDMTLRQAYNNKLPLKDKLYIIIHLLFNING